jgi:hypothetical protein
MRYDTKIVGNTERDTFPYAVINLDTGQIVKQYSHMQTADDVVMRLNGHGPSTIYDVTEADEQMPHGWSHVDTSTE